MVAREMRLAKVSTDSLGEGGALNYVFIDCPPSLGLLTINAFVAAREVLIPIQCEYYALEGLSQLLSNIALIERHLNPKLAVSTILLTMYDGANTTRDQVADDVRDHFPNQTLDGDHPAHRAHLRSPQLRPDRHQLRPKSTGALSYLEAASEIAHRGAEYHG